MQGTFKPVIDPAATAVTVFQQMLNTALQADNQAARIHDEFMGLLRSLKSGEVSLDLVEVGENGFSILPPEPVETGANGHKDEEALPDKTPLSENAEPSLVGNDN